MPPENAILVSPFYHEAKNEITRPGHFVACSRYLVEQWLPRLGPLGFALVLHLRSLGYYNPSTGECRDCIQVNQTDLCAVLGVSSDTLQRELKRNEALGAFVRVEKVYQRREAGHLARLDSQYYIAMDDPLVSEDEPRLAAILERKQADGRETRTGKAVIRPLQPEQEAANRQQPEQGAAERQLPSGEPAAAFLPPPQESKQVKQTAPENRTPQTAAYGNFKDCKPQNAVYGTVSQKTQIAAYGKLDRKPQFAANIIDIPVESYTNTQTYNNNIQPVQNEKGAVVVDFLFCDNGVWKTDAEAAATWLDIEEARVYAFWAQSIIAAKGGSIGPLLASLLRDHTSKPIPADVRKAYLKGQQSAQRKAEQVQREQQKQEKVVEEKVARQNRAESLQAFVQRLTPEQAKSFDGAALSRIRKQNTFAGQRLEKNRNALGFHEMWLSAQLEEMDAWQLQEGSNTGTVHKKPQT